MICLNVLSHYVLVLKTCSAKTKYNIFQLPFCIYFQLQSFVECCDYSILFALDIMPCTMRSSTAMGFFLLSLSDFFVIIVRYMQIFQQVEHGILKIQIFFIHQSRFKVYATVANRILLCSLARIVKKLTRNLYFV